MLTLRIFFVADILDEIALHIPVQVLDDIAILLDEIKKGGLFGQLPFWPEIKNG